MDISMSAKTQSEEKIGLDAKQVCCCPLTLDRLKPSSLQQACYDIYHNLSVFSHLISFLPNHSAQIN